MTDHPKYKATVPIDGSRQAPVGRETSPDGGAALGKLERLEETLRRLDDSLSGSELSLGEQPTVLAEAVSARRRMPPRLAEFSDVSQRLEEMSAQAMVASLNVNIEISRREKASPETLAVLAEEIRRLAERTATATRRCSILIKDLEEASEVIASSLERAREGHDQCSEKQSGIPSIVDCLNNDLADLKRSLKGVMVTAQEGGD